MRSRARRRASSSERCGPSAWPARPRGTNPEMGRTPLSSFGGITAETPVRGAGFCTVTSAPPGAGARREALDARRASNAPVKSPVDAPESGDGMPTGGGGGGAVTPGDASDGYEIDAAAGAGAAEGADSGGGADGVPIVGIALVRPGSANVCFRLGTGRLPDSSIARSASRASVGRGRDGAAGGGGGGAAIVAAGGAGAIESASSSDGGRICTVAPVDTISKRAIFSPVG